MAGGDAQFESPRGVLFDYIRCPEFKRLLNQVVGLQKTKDVKSLSVLSEYSGEGKTFLVSVLALGYATFLRKRVLIMDTISQTRDESFYLGHVLGSVTQGFDPLDLEERGAIDLITSRSLFRQIQLFENHEPPAPINEELPVPYDERYGFETSDFQIGPFISSLTDSYDLILLDTCALSQVGKDNLDPMIIAPQTGGAMLVTSSLSLERGVIQRVKRELKKCKVELVGTIFNDGPRPI